MAALPAISNAPLPILYSKARNALAKCYSVDECRDWTDKALALASYARQARDSKLAKLAMRIQGRATRRCGELLREIEARQGSNQNIREGDRPNVRTRSQAATEAGLSEHQRKTALRVAAIPEADFDAQIESEDPPTVSALAEQGTRKKPVPLYDLDGIAPEDFKAATAALGIIHEFRDFGVRTDPRQVVRGLKQKECQELCANVQQVRAWLTRLEDALQCTATQI